MDNQEKNDSLEKPYQVTLLNEVTEEEWNQIIQLERKTFDWGMTEEDMQQTKEATMSERGVVVVTKNENQEITGYVIGYSETEAHNHIHGEDPNMPSDGGTVYILTVAIDESIRGGSALREGMSAFYKGASEKGYSRISAHTPSGRMPMYERLLGAEAQHEIENWCDSGEAHTYWSAELAK